MLRDRHRPGKKARTVKRAPPEQITFREMHDDPWAERILRVLDHIQSHLDEDLAPEQLARHAGFSLHHFHRIFRGMTGESVMGCVRRLRLDRAATRLRFGTEPVTDVALRSGYGSHEGFTRAFRARFGQAPSAFREGHRQSEAELRESGVVRVEPPRLCVAYRYTGPYEQCEQAWAELDGWARSSGIAERALASIGLAYDDPDVTEASKLRYDAGYVLAPEDAAAVAPPRGRFALRHIPEGRYAILEHRGSFENILDTYVALLGRWLPKQGEELADEPVVEVYLTDPMTTAPEDLRTEVCVRLS